MVGASFQDDGAVLSPPIVTQVSAECGTLVAVRGYVRGATIDVLVNMVNRASGVAGGLEAVFDVGTLAPGDRVEARQSLGGAMSGWSDPVFVEAIPNTLPTSSVVPYPLYDCGRIVGSGGHLAGARVLVFRERDAMLPPDTILDTPMIHPWMAGVTPPFEVDDIVTTQYQVCGSTLSPLSDDEVVIPAIVPGPPLIADGYTDDAGEFITALSAGAEYIVVSNTVPGATVRIIDETSTVIGEDVAWHPDGRLEVQLVRPLEEGELIVATQELCDPSSPSPPVGVLGCDEIPPARIDPPQVGDRAVRVIEFVVGARIRVYADEEEVGDGTGPVVRLTRALRVGEEVHVVQETASMCSSPYTNFHVVDCKDTSAVPNPRFTGDYEVVIDEYLLSNTVTLGQRDVRINGLVAFPQHPLDANPAVAPGPAFPLVLIMHGNHGTYVGDNMVPGSDPSCPSWPTGADGCCASDPVPESEEEIDSFAGYVPLLEALARGGYIAASINANDINCTPGTNDYYGPGIALFEEHLAFWQALDEGTLNEEPFDPPLAAQFRGRVDLAHVVLMGHSRGGDRAIGASRAHSGASDYPRVVSAVGIAPPWNNFRSDLTSAHVPVLLLYGSRDRDVLPDQSGWGAPIRLFDASTPEPYLALRFLDGANHAQWNSRWGTTDPNGEIANPSQRIDSAVQQAALASWGRAWVDLTVRGLPYMEVFTTDREIDSIPVERVRASYRNSTDLAVDLHENQNPDAFPGGTNSVSGMFMVLTEGSFRPGKGPNDTFMHDTDGLFLRGSGSPASFFYDPTSAIDALAYGYLSFRGAVAANEMSPQPSSPFVATVSLLGGATTDTIMVSEALLAEEPYDDLWPITVLETIRIPISCMAEDVPTFNQSAITQIDLQFPSSHSSAVDEVVFSQ